MEMIGNLNKMIKGGIYLVIDPSLPQALLFEKLEQVLEAGIDVLQIWDHWSEDLNKERIITEICSYCRRYEVPVMINNHWELLNTLPLDGVHFDAIPRDYANIKRKVGKSFFAGLTCNNDLAEVAWAEQNAFDYLSFCSMFPSATSTSCALVSFETVEETRKITHMPVFLAGGITLSNMEKLAVLDFDGIALVSGIMSSENPADATKHYSQKLTVINQKSIPKNI